MAPATALRVDRVLLDVRAGDPGGVFAAVAGELAAGGLVQDAAAVARALAERESTQSTAVGHGIAMPHARIAGQGRGVLAIARLAAPVVFGAVSPQPVDLVVVIVSPAEEPGEHVKLLAKIARRLHDPACVERLRGARDVRTLRAALEES